MSLDLCAACGSFGGNRCAKCKSYFCVSHGDSICNDCGEKQRDELLAAQQLAARIRRLIERRRDEYARGTSQHYRTAFFVVNDLLDSINFIVDIIDAEKKRKSPP